jgi:hypothetical protein
LIRFVFGLFRNSLFRFYTETDSFDVSIELKQTEHQPKQVDREHVLVFFRKFRVVSVCFGLFVSVLSILVQNTKTSRNKPKFFVFGFTKLTETKPKQILFRLFRFEPNILFVCFKDTLVKVMDNSPQT